MNTIVNCADLVGYLLLLGVFWGGGLTNLLYWEDVNLVILQTVLLLFSYFAFSVNLLEKLSFVYLQPLSLVQSFLFCLLWYHLFNFILFEGKRG